MTDGFRATFDGVDIIEYVNREDVQRVIESAGEEAARKIYEQWVELLATALMIPSAGTDSTFPSKTSFVHPYDMSSGV